MIKLIRRAESTYACLARLAGLMACSLLLGLGGCAQIEKQADAADMRSATPASTPVRVSSSEMLADLVRHAQRVRSMSVKMLAEEIERLRLAQIHDGDDVLALQYAAALSAPAASIAQQKRAQSLLDLYAAAPAAPGRDSGFLAFAMLLRAELVERRRLEDVLHAQIQKAREDQRNIEDLERKLEVATKKLDALVNIERKLLQRGKNSGGGK